MANPFVHIELNTDDVDKSKKFYKTVFGWKISPMPGSADYLAVDVEGGTGGGMQKKPMLQAPTAWLPYVGVESVKKTLAKALKNGAQVALDYTPIGDMGAIGVLVDPSGASIGLWEAAPPAKPAPAAKTTAAKPKKAAPKVAAKPAPAKAASKPAPKAAASKSAPPAAKPPVKKKA